MVKILIFRNDDEPLEIVGDTVLLSSMTVRSDGSPETARAQISGKFNLPSLLVMTRMVVEHAERIARTEFGAEDFDILQVMSEMMDHRDPLDELDVDTSVPN